MSTVPSYLLLSRHSVFYFRIVVPEVIRPLFPQREIRRSLQTRCRREALIRGRELLLQAQRLFTEAFQGRRPSLDILSGAWEAGGKRVASWASWLRQQQLVSTFEAVIANPREQPSRGPQKANTAPIRDEPPLAPSFSKVVDEYLRQQAREGVSTKTLDDKRAMASLFVRVIGDHPINLITRKETQLFRETALKLPPRIHQLSVTSLEQAIAEAKTTISQTTFNNYVKNLTTFFAYAIREGYCDKNPLYRLGIKRRGKVNQERSAFTEADLKALFDRSRYAPANGPKPNQYWLPLLGLYTGARLNELCQLYLDDIVVVNGVDCLHIRKGRPDQKLKNDGSERLVPIHSRLKALGFMEYVASLRVDGHARLFPELTLHKKHGYSAAPSKWFARVRAQLGFEGKKDFHSFRHTFADHLKQKGVSEALVGGVLGHQTGGITFGRYGKDFRPEVLVPVVEMVTLKAP